jgi:hypothetical protein
VFSIFLRYLEGFGGINFLNSGLNIRFRNMIARLISVLHICEEDSSKRVFVTFALLKIKNSELTFKLPDEGITALNCRSDNPEREAHDIFIFASFMARSAE